MERNSAGTMKRSSTHVFTHYKMKYLILKKDCIQLYTYGKHLHQNQSMLSAIVLSSLLFHIFPKIISHNILELYPQTMRSY